MGFLFFFANATFSQLALNQKIDKYYTEVDHALFPGAAVGVWKDGKIIFAKGYGYANLEHQAPFTTSTISDIGSVAKQFTSFGIILLAQQGKLKLDDDIRKHLDFVPDFGKTIQIRHLIHHTSGLREIYGTESLRGRRGGDAIFQEDVIQMVSAQQGLNFDPGTQYLYCNTAYALLAEIIKKVSGQPFETWMKENIFAVLGMDHTYIMDRQGEIFPNTADSYYQFDDSLYVKAYDNSTINGQGGIYSSLEDMMRWLQNIANPELGGQAAFQQMTTRGILNNGDTLKYAFGINVDSYRGLKRLSHSGASAGYRAYLTYFPEHDLGIFIKTASPSTPMGEVLISISEHFLANFMDPRPEKAIEKEPKEEAEYVVKNLDDYAGFYFSPELEAGYHFVIDNGRLQGMHFRHGVFDLSPKAKDLFASKAFFMNKIQFNRNKKGKVTGLRASNGRTLNVWFEKR